MALIFATLSLFKHSDWMLIFLNQSGRLEMSKAHSNAKILIIDSVSVVVDVLKLLLEEI